MRILSTGFQTQLVQTLGRERTWLKPRSRSLYTRTAGHEHSALNGVIEFRTLPGPAVLEHGLQGARLKAATQLAIARSVAGEKVRRPAAGISSRRSRSGGR